jgi:transcriptional regulator with XRE-family HTH domain
MTAPIALSAAVGRRLRELRVSSGISLDELARQADLRPSALVAIEEGRARPSVATLVVLSKRLRMTVLELVKSASATTVATAPNIPSTPAPARAPIGLEGIARAVAELPSRLGDKLDAVGGAVVVHAMEQCGGNRSAAARLLGMERKALIRRWQRVQRESRPRGRKSV